MLKSVLALLIATNGHALGELHLQTKVDLSKLVSEGPGFLGQGQHSIFAIAFSPDEKVIAVAAGFHNTQGGPTTHIVGLSIIDVETKFERTIPTSGVKTLKWSANGNHLLAQSNDGSWIINLQKNGDCHVGDWSTMGGFVTETTFLVARRTLNSTTLRFYDTDCNRIEETTISERVRSLDTADQLIAFSGDFGDIHILHGPTWKNYVTLTDAGAGLTINLLERGKTICSGRVPGPGDSTFRCWALDGPIPRQISAWPAKRAGTEPTSGAAAVPLVLFMDRAFTYNVFTENTRTGFKRWVIWDARTGILADQLPGKMQVLRFGTDSRISAGFPWASAISPSGRLLAIGGDNVIEVYTLSKSLE